MLFLMIAQKVEKVCHFERQREIFRCNFLARHKISPVGRNDNRAIRTFCEAIIFESAGRFSFAMELPPSFLSLIKTVFA